LAKRLMVIVAAGVWSSSPDDEGLAGLDVAQHALDHEVFSWPGLLPLVDAPLRQPGGGLVPEGDKGDKVVWGCLGDAHYSSRS
jgi:hypothetical protein